jgi:hypothetical protein
MAKKLSPALLVRITSLCLAILTGGCIGINAAKQIQLQVYPVVTRTKTPTDSQMAMIEESVLFIDSAIRRNGMALTWDTYSPWDQSRYRYYEGIEPCTRVHYDVCTSPRKGWVRVTIVQPNSLWDGGFSGSAQFKAIYQDLSTNLAQHFGRERLRL